MPNGDYVYSYSNNSEPAGDVLLFKASDGTSETDVHAAIFNFEGVNWQRFVRPSALADNVNIAEDEELVSVAKIAESDEEEKEEEANSESAE